VGLHAELIEGTLEVEGAGAQAVEHDHPGRSQVDFLGHAGQVVALRVVGLAGGDHGDARFFGLGQLGAELGQGRPARINRSEVEPYGRNLAVGFARTAHGLQQFVQRKRRRFVAQLGPKLVHFVGTFRKASVEFKVQDRGVGNAHDRVGARGRADSESDQYRDQQKKSHKRANEGSKKLLHVFLCRGPQARLIMSAKVLNVLILLGSNSEDAAKVLTQARAELAKRVPVRREGSLWRTAAWGFEGPDFLNQVLEVQWSGEPMALLEMVLEVERSLGRVRDAQGPRYASRSIDIDLLLTQPFLALATPQLELPHPRMPMRRFVLQPVAEFWREWQADASGASVGDLLDRCSDQNAVHLHSNLNDHDL